MKDLSLALLKHKVLNGWSLFSLIAVPMSLGVLMAMATADLSSPAGISSLLQLSVRCSVPWLYVAFAASSLHMLLSNEFSRWLLVNRRIFGLCFAAGMAWQLMFILWMVTGHWNYYAEEVYLFVDVVVQIPGYVFLIAMAVTSFRPVRRKLSPKHWRTLHKIGIYVLWGTVWSTYWYELYYYEDIQVIDYVYYWAGFLAFALRIVAWGKKRQQAAIKSSPGSSTPLAFNVLGSAIIGFGLFAAATVLYWQKPVTAYLTAPQWSADLVLWLPFWPYEPYFSLFIIGLGAMLVTKASATGSESAQDQSEAVHA